MKIYLHNYCLVHSKGVGRLRHAWKVNRKRFPKYNQIACIAKELLFHLEYPKR